MHLVHPMSDAVRVALLKLQQLDSQTDAMAVDGSAVRNNSSGKRKAREASRPEDASDASSASDGLSLDVDGWGAEHGIDWFVRKYLGDGKGPGR